MDKKKILIIDDEKSLCKLVRVNLEFTGKFEVSEAYSGEEGLRKAGETDYDLVLTDFRMPGMNGEQVLDELKKIKPKSPVVLFSVYHDDASVITRSIRDKADAIISKPFDSKQLIGIIEKLLAKTGE